MTNDTNKNIVCLIIDGDPVGKGRPRFRRMGSIVSTYTDKKTSDYEKRIKDAYWTKYKHFTFFDKPVEIVIDCHFGVPKSTTKKDRVLMLANEISPTKKPDIDNVCKMVLDGLNTLAYNDDSQVIKLTVIKKYDLAPSVWILVKEFENGES
jgi:Holliday junction resolvase RusA-like endonuclease